MVSKKVLLIIIISWLLLIAGFVISNEFTLKSGREVLLKTVPIDPRDLLRGDYVMLRYEISEAELALDYKPNSTVYTILNLDDENIASISFVAQKKPENMLFIKGNLKQCHTLDDTKKCRIEYGIESYFVKEGTGKIIEKELRKGALVKVKLDSDGNAKVTDFIHN